MVSQAMGYAIVFSVQTAFLALALWIMIRIQQQQYNMPGLLGAAALASGLDMIPFVGHYVAFAALLLCMVKVTHEEYSDVVFTVVISYALMFCMNLFLLGSLMGDVRPDLKGDPEQAYGDFFDPDETNELARLGTGANHANKTPSATNAPQPVTNVSHVHQAISSIAQTNAASQPATNRVAAVAGTNAMHLKSLIKNGKLSTALIGTGVTSYTLMLGDVVTIKTFSGEAKVRWLKLEEQAVVLDVDGKAVRLSLPKK